jgi:hypothetical protein
MTGMYTGNARSVWSVNTSKKINLLSKARRELKNFCTAYVYYVSMSFLACIRYADCLLFPSISNAVLQRKLIF